MSIVAYRAWATQATGKEDRMFATTDVDKYRPDPRPWWRRLSHRFSDWVWDLLTRDLYPYVPPERQEGAWLSEDWRRW